MNVKHRINMDLTGQAVMPRIDMVERDQYVRQLEFALTCNGEPWDIPEDVHPIICFVKADGTGGEYDSVADGVLAWSVEGNILTVDVAPQVLTCAGPVMLAVDILRGDAKISTFTVMLYVQEAVPLGLESGDYFQIDGFLAAPRTVKVGQLLRVSAVNDHGVITQLEGVTLEEILNLALSQAKESGEFDGPSAYEVAVANGFEGTEEEWLESLQGEDCRFAETAELGDIQQINVTGRLTTDSDIIVNFKGTRIQGVSDPVEETDAANKAYADLAAKKARALYHIPEYWRSAVNTVIDKITGYQDAGGKSCVSFAYFSDPHYVPDSTIPNAGHTGNLIAAVMDGCGIPFAALCGDAGNRNAVSEAEVREGLRAAETVLAPVDQQRLLQALGSTDGVWGSSQLGTGAVYGALFRKQTEDSRRVFGGDGTYYYLDYPVVKLRFIVLNSSWVDETHLRKEHAGFGNAQLHWLAETALRFQEEDWGVILIAHVPPIADMEPTVRDEAVLRGILAAFQGQKSYSGTGGTEGEWDYVDLTCDFSEAITGEIIGFFCGYLHKDTITTGETPCAVVTVTSDADLSEDENEPMRFDGTDTEHAIDFVTVNRETKLVYLTRLGMGDDRIYGYGDGAYVLYTVTNHLTNCTSDCDTDLAEEWDYYEANLTADSGYALSSVTVTMGGADITESAYADGVVTIEEVTGNVIITAVAQ